MATAAVPTRTLGPLCRPGGRCWGSGMRDMQPAGSWSGAATAGPLGHMDQPDAGSGRAPGRTETPQRPPRCPSSGKEATPGIEPAISHGSASRGPSRPGCGFRENVRGDLLLRSRSAVCVPNEGAATGRRFRVREAWSRACGRKKCPRLPHRPRPGLTPCAWPCLPRLSACSPRPQLPNPLHPPPWRLPRSASALRQTPQPCV